jgi:sugar lactone lactonase YvrE
MLTSFKQMGGFLAGAALLALLASGCATSKPAAPKTYTLFPPPPDQARVQFLAGFSSDLDLGRKGTFSEYLTGRKLDANRLAKPYGLALKDGKLYVCDTAVGAVQIFDLAKKRSRYLRPRGEGLLVLPANISVDDDGVFYVADTGRNKVLIFDQKDTCLGAIGKEGEMKPADVAVSRDRIYIADVKGHCVRVYSKQERELLFTIPRDPKAEQGRLYTPTNLALDPQGRLLVSDTGGFAVQVYDLDGKFLRTLGGQGVAPGLFARARGVAVAREGLAYVADASTQVVQIFNPEGKLLLVFGAPGATAEGELYLPAAVKVNYDSLKFFEDRVAPGYKLDHLILVDSQFGAHRVGVYGFLQKK